MHGGVKAGRVHAPSFKQQVPLQPAQEHRSGKQEDRAGIGKGHSFFFMPNLHP